MEHFGRCFWPRRDDAAKVFPTCGQDIKGRGCPEIYDHQWTTVLFVASHRVTEPVGAYIFRFFVGNGNAEVEVRGHVDQWNVESLTYGLLHSGCQAGNNRTDSHAR